ncbi:F-box domain-containing protein [Rutstroemia sp. NJR-2017a WRK4]|nr:F-box domain-containing protein [Rutstroemia sp. NJR-2017a WRK4]
MSITKLSTELLQKIYESCDLIDALHLSQTSKRHYSVLRGRYLPILGRALNNSYGPIPSLHKLVISSEPEKKGRRAVGTEIRRNALVDRIVQLPDDAPLSIELMTKMVSFGRIATKWVEIFPQFRWRIDYKNRRFLKAHEQQRMRRALYHYWTYCNLFHDQIYTQFDPDFPGERRPRDPRLRLVRTYSTIELVQLSEFLKHVVLLIETDLYPSNSVIEASHNFSPKAVAKIAWGYGAGYRYLVDDLLKYSPLDLLYLFENTYTKTERAEYLIAQGLAFEDAPATLERAISCVSFERQALDPTGGLKNLFYPALTPRSHMAKQQENVRYGIADYEGQDGYLEDDPYNHDGDRSGVSQS